MRTVLVAAAFSMLVGCTETSPQPGEKVSFKPYHPPHLTAGETSQICLLADATNPAGDVRPVDLGADELIGRVEFFDMRGNALDYGNISFEYG